MTKNKRVFVPTSKFIIGTRIPISVARWEWTKGHGLKVIYADGRICKSSWGTLKAFLRAVEAGLETPVREL